ncbi:AAA family ATPase [Candidatus Frankia nodulisporulans]|uniref:AAA family ATPase n=1 Tax=Candidatus Frankia nodulisporulans TaxID=2060052 RepID=UPI003B839F10
MCLVVLVGVSGSGKSTFARAHFRSTQVLSSDVCRGLVADDENDQSATPDAFDVLHYIAGKRLAAGRLTVVDATNVQSKARASLVHVAREHDVLPVAIVLDLPERVCVARNAERADRAFGPAVIRRQAADLRRSLRGLAREGFRRVHVLHSVDEVAGATIEYTKLFTDLRHETGPFDIIGDVHGCLDELEQLLTRLGYHLRRDADGSADGGGGDGGRPVSAWHPDGRRVVFVGDLVDRGPAVPGVLRLAMGMVAEGTAFAVCGNHENKLVRALAGRKVTVGHGLAASLEQLAAEPAEFQARATAFCQDLVSHYVLDAGRLVVAHAGLKEAYHNRASARVRSFALYGDTTGETDEYGLPVRLPWARDYRGRATVVHGHTPTPEPEWVNNTLCVDTGCVFGGSLSALRYPERELVAVPAARVYVEPTRPLTDPPTTPTAPPTTPTALSTSTTGPSASTTAPTSSAIVPDAGLSGPAIEVSPPVTPRDRGPAGVVDLLDVTDVLGRRFLETRHGGRVRIDEENALAALEVMSRFALDPRWLVYLPPTMSPPPTSAQPGLLEHPAEAFAAYRADGVDRLICQEKHMGLRAVVVLCRDAGVAATRFGATDGPSGAVTGAVYTRTGRPFFAPELTEQLLARLRTASERAGLWDELAADWLVFDAEIMPWSAKASDLVARQYAAAGAAARGALPVALEALTSAAGRGIDVAELLGRTSTRLANVEAFTDAYRRYCWPVDGLTGIRIAPFMLLVSAAKAAPAGGTIGGRGGDDGSDLCAAPALLAS